MKLTLVRSLTAAVVMVSATALAQTDPAPATSALPAAPSAASAPVASTPAAIPTGGAGLRIGTINIEAAIFASNEGQRDGDAVAKKLEPKQAELKKLSDEIDGWKKQLSTQGPSLSEDAKGDLTNKIATNQKTLERNQQDLQEEARNQENEIAQRILRKMGPLIVDYAGKNGFGLILDTSTNNQWPQGAILWQNPAIDITKPVVDLYNVQSGVAPPPKPSGATGTKPAGTGITKPATTPSTTTKPPATQPPAK